MTLRRHARSETLRARQNAGLRRMPWAEDGRRVLRWRWIWMPGAVQSSVGGGQDVGEVADL